MKLTLPKNVAFIIVMTITMAYAQVLASQDTLSIASGQDNAGLLETTINNDVDGDGNRIHPNRVYKLEAGLHFVQSAIDVNNDGGTVTIVGATGGTKPVIIPLVVNDIAPKRNKIRSNLTLKNVHMQGRDTEGAYWGGHMWNVIGNDRSLIVHDCVMESASRGFFLQKVPQGLKMEFRNNYFRDFHDPSQLWAGNVMDAKNIPIESFIFENNTVSNGNCVLLLQGNFIKYALINHNTFINTSTFFNLNPYWYEAYITNNVFVNANMIGSEFNLIANEPDKVVFPIIAMDTLDIRIGTAAIPAYAKNADETALVAPYNSIDNYKIYLADNVYHNEATLEPYHTGAYNDLYDAPVSYLSWYAAGPHRVDVPAKWTDMREASFFADNAGIIEENNLLNQDPQLATTALSTAGAEAMAIWIRRMYEVAEETRTPDFSSYYFGDFNPLTIPGIESEDGAGVNKISDFTEDFSINSSFISMSDGHAIGALHWTDEIDRFDADASLSAIITAYNNAMSPAIADTLYIAGGPDNAGLLETTINNDVDGAGNRIHPNRVYKLDAGLHFVQSAIDVNNDGGTVTIVGATGGTKPVIVPLVVNDIAPKRNKIRSNLTLKNVHMQGRDTEGAYWGGHMWNVIGNDRSLIVHDCVMESASRGFFLQKVPQGLKMEFRNNYFRDFHDPSQLWAGNVMDAKNIPIESFIFENNTVSNGNCVLLLQGNFINYALINHNTFINTSTFLNLNPYWYEAYITNNVFVNANMIGSEFNLIANEPDKVVFPIIAMDTLDIRIGTAAIPAYAKNADETALVAPYNSIDNYKIYLADNVYHNEATLEPYHTGTYNDLYDAPVSYLSWYAQGPHRVDVPAKWTDMREASFFADNAGIIEENNLLNQDPQLATTALSTAGAEAMAIWIRRMYEVAEETRTPDFSSYYFGDFNPLTIPGIESEDGAGVNKISDFTEDFSINSSFVSMSDGHAIGALHWTDEIESFDSDESLSNIIAAYNNAMGPAIADTLYVAGGQGNAGLLETTINNDVDGAGNRIHPNRVYKLEAGLHFVQSAIDVNNEGGTVTIVGATGGTKPVIVPLVVNDVAPARNEINSNLTLKNVHMQGRDTEGAYWGGQMWNVKGNDRSLIVHDCVMESASRGFYLQEVPQGLTMEFRNNYFRDFHDPSQLWAGNVMDAKNIPIESFIFENNTVSNGNCVLLLQGNFINYALINHNTFINTSTFLNLNPYWYEAYITNNVFVNANMIGSEFNLIANEPDQVVFPIIAMDTLDIRIGTAAIPAYAKNADETALVAPYNSIDNYKIYLADNVYHNEATLEPYHTGTYNDLYDAPVSYLSWYAQGPHRVDVPAKWTDMREASFFADNAGIVEENNMLDQDPQLATTALSTAGAEAMAIWMRKMYEVAAETRTPDFSSYYFGDFNPLTIPGIESEDGAGVTKISDFTEDFAINSSFISMSDGHTIGALHWTSEIDNFDPAASLSSIMNRYESAMTTDVKEEDIFVNAAKNFPNPFREMTIINFELKERTAVRLTVSNIYGQQIATLVDGELNVGQHNITWDAAGVSSGVYLFTFEAGEFKTSKKMMVTK